MSIRSVCSNFLKCKAKFHGLSGNHSQDMKIFLMKCVADPDSCLKHFTELKTL